MRRVHAALAVLLASAAAAAQDPPDPALLRFEALDFRHKAAVTRAIQRALQQIDDPLARRIAAMGYDTATLPDAPGAPPIHEPARFAAEEHAAGRAPTRRVVAPGEPAHRAVVARFARVPFLPELRREVRYDWATGRVVRGAAPSYEDLFANALHGYLPGSDHAVARVLEVLDRAPAQRALGAWFGHAYCDLEARAFPPVTLYDAWYSGAIVDVPDVDAIPFAWDVLGWKSYRSPLSGPPRDRLYEEIRRAALRHRVHRTLCEAAAAAWVRADPAMDPTYARLVPRFHYLWSTLGDDPAALAAKLGSADRDALLDEVDTAVRRPEGTAYEVREARRRQLAELAGRVRAIALAALERYGA